MKQLVIVRHGDAGPYTQPDDARPLSDLGWSQVRKAAAHLECLGWQGVTLWHSPYIRAAQTAACLSEYLGGACLTMQGLTPDDSPDELIRRLDLEDVPDRLILVSHMSFVAVLEARLTGARGEPFMTAEARLLSTETCWYPGQAIRQRVMRPL